MVFKTYHQGAKLADMNLNVCDKLKFSRVRGSENKSSLVEERKKENKAQNISGIKAAQAESRSGPRLRSDHNEPSLRHEWKYFH